MLDRYDIASSVPLRINRGEVIIPLYRLGVPEFDEGALEAIWSIFKDWRRGNVH